MTAATLNSTDTVLFLAFELGWSRWKLIFTLGGAHNPRIREIAGRDLVALQAEIAKAKLRLKLPDDTPVVSCYEAGRDGFWLHRWLLAQGICNFVVDASSIQVPRRNRRVKTDRVDGQKLAAMLERHFRGERKVWSVVQAPKSEIEDLRHVHRELETLTGERTEHVNRIKGLLAAVGLAIKEVDADFGERIDALRQWDGQPIGADLKLRLQREYERWLLVQRQVHELEIERGKRLQHSNEPCMEQARSLQQLKAIGPTSAWLFGLEFFGWRDFRNGRQVGALAGLTPMPYQSGDMSREQGISKAGNRRVRALAIEIAWLWLRYQPNSALAQWYKKRFGGGKSRQRRIGIVALARRLLIALWKYLKWGEIPEGAVLKEKKSRKKAS